MSAQEDLIRMAREAGYSVKAWCLPAELGRFAAIVTAAEREKCANICDDLAEKTDATPAQQFALDLAADAIRDRGNS